MMHIPLKNTLTLANVAVNIHGRRKAREVGNYKKNSLSQHIIEQGAGEIFHFYIVI